MAHRVIVCAWLAAIGVFASTAHAAPAAAATTARSASTSLAPSAASPASPFKVDVWLTEQGLPLNTVQTTYQSRTGPLWVGTAGGLARFDGIRFNTFEGAMIPELAGKAVFAFFEDREGTLWIGHARGIARYRHGRFESVLGADVTDGRRVAALTQAADGTLWAASENGLIRWRMPAQAENDEPASAGTTKPASAGTTKPAPAKAMDVKVYLEADGLPTKRLRSLTFDRDGTLWIATTGGGLVSFANGTFRARNPDNGFPHAEVRYVLADPAGGVWATTPGAGLVRIVGDKMERFTTKEGLTTDQLTSLARDAAGALWIGTWGAGIMRMHEGRVTSVSSANGLNGLSGDQVWSLEVDREGSVWIGTWNGGLNRISPRAFGVIGKPEGLSNDNVRAILHARDGTTWISTAGGGVHRVVAGRIEAIAKKDGLASDESSALAEDADGVLWAGSYTDGVSRVQLSGANKKPAIENLNDAHGLPNLDVRMIYRDRAGTRWVGTRAGVAKFDGKKFVPFRPPGAPLEGVITMLEDRSGTMWFGTAGQGLFRFRDNKFETLTRKDGLVSNWILALHEDADGALWIGTNGEGLNRLKNDRIAAVRASDGLWDNTVQVIIEDRSGHFWITSNRGFYRVARAALNDFIDERAPSVSSNGFGPGEALRSTTFAGGLQPAGAMDANGQLWLPSQRGVVIVDPARLPGSEAPPAVAIDELMLDGVAAAVQSNIVLPPGSVPLTIRYATNTLRHAERVRFRYRMEGVHKDWVDAGKSREAAFPALPRGTFQFRVAATIDGQRWHEADAPLAVTVKPHFYQTPWFVVAAMLAALGAGAGLFRLRTHQLHKRQSEMEQLIAAKTEELRLANAHLSALSFADGLTGLANRRRLDATLDAEWRRAARQQSSLAIMMVDIDGFKAYNDALGHLEGDKCLVAVASVIRGAASRAGDLAARYGGEEFAVLIPGDDLATAREHAERLRAICEAHAIPHPASPVSAVVTISVGVAAMVPTAESTPADLIAAADAALYRAKHEGRNRVGV